MTQSLAERAMALAARFTHHQERALMMPKTLAEPLPPGMAVGAAPVILLSGYAGTREHVGVWNRSLRRDGFKTHIFTSPENGLGRSRTAVDALLRDIEVVRSITGSDRVSFIGHSRGGLIARDAIVHHLDPEDVETIVTVASPHRGIILRPSIRKMSEIGFADLLLPKSRNELLEGSDWITSLNDRDIAELGINAVSLHAARTDPVVAPESAYWQGARNYQLKPPLPLPHLTIMTHDERAYRIARWELLRGAAATR